MEIDQGEQPVASVEDRMMALLDGPDAGEPEEEAQPETEAPEAEAEAQAEEEAAEPEYEEIVHNGEAKKLTKDEIKTLAQQGFDYTQKTQQLAEQKRQFEAQVQQAQQSFAIQNQQLDIIAEIKSLDAKISQFKEINWIERAEADPVEYLKLNQAFRDLKEARDAKVGEFNQRAMHLQQLTAEQTAQLAAREREQLTNKLPEFKGEKAETSRQQLRTYLAESGFNDSEISGVMDHRQILVAWKAMQYDKLKASQPQVTKKVADVPKAVKPGAATNKSQAADRDLRQKLKQTGKGDYAAKLIERML